MKKTKRLQRGLTFLVVVIFITVIACKGVVEGGIGGGYDDAKLPMRVVMGGGFSTVGGSAHNYIARVNADLQALEFQPEQRQRV
ncbi:MAG TPA: hypothetical protein VMX75_08940 [Spirochaetia bacterium]|nr:hypothetical protein [Spirochaetia bacterium]